MDTITCNSIPGGQLWINNTAVGYAAGSVYIGQQSGYHAAFYDGRVDEDDNGYVDVFVDEYREELRFE